MLLPNSAKYMADAAQTRRDLTIGQAALHPAEVFVPIKESQASRVHGQRPRIASTRSLRALHIRQPQLEIVRVRVFLQPNVRSSTLPACLHQPATIPTSDSAIRAVLFLPREAFVDLSPPFYRTSRI